MSKKSVKIEAKNPEVGMKVFYYPNNRDFEIQGKKNVTDSVEAEITRLDQQFRVDLKIGEAVRRCVRYGINKKEEPYWLYNRLRSLNPEE